MSNRVFRIVIACVALAAMIAAGDARAEGSLEIGESQGLQSETEILVDIINPDSESIQWHGYGTVAVFQPDGVTLVGTIGNEEAIAAVSGVFGAYVLVLDSDQSGAWDIAVLGGAPGYGRVHSYAWVFDTGSYGETEALSGSLFVKVEAGSSYDYGVVELLFDGYAGYSFTILLNADGVGGDAACSSVPRAAVDPPEGLHAVYLNPPEDASYSTLEPQITPVSFTSGALSCDGVILPGASDGVFSFYASTEGTYHVMCDLDDDGVFDISHFDDVLLHGAVTDPAVEVPWTGIDRFGDPIPPGAYTCIVDLVVGEVHLVSDDVETSFEGLRLFVVDASLARSPMPMFWNDATVQANAVMMPNGQIGLESSGPNGLDSGDYNLDVDPNVNARSWGDFTSFGKGNGAYLDTFSWIDADRSSPFQVVAADSSSDGDGDGINTYTEDCELGTSDGDDDSDDDLIGDYVETDGGFPVDTDSDTTIDALDADSDNDGVSDLDENMSGTSWRDPHECGDVDVDGCDDCTIGTDGFGPLPDNDPANDGLDTDGDGLCDPGDNCPDDGNPDQADADGDGIGDVCDLCFGDNSSGDSDGDGICDNLEIFQDGFESGSTSAWS